jgi:trigger factor
VGTIGYHVTNSEPSTLGLSVRKETLPGSQVALTIEVPSEQVDQAWAEAIEHMARRVKLPGFRPGKAPRSVLEARLGPAAIREHAIDDLLPVVVGEALRGEGIDPIDRPRVDVIHFEKGEPARLTATVSVMPDVKLADLGGLHVERGKTEVTDEMVERRLEELLETQATVEPVDRPVQEGDVVVADLDVYTPEGDEVESARRRAMEIEVKEGVLIPELRAALPGTPVDGVAEADVDMPEDAADVELRGKRAHLKMTVRGVKEKKLPRLDDALAVQISNGEQRTALELKIAIRRDLEEQARRLDELGHEQKVLKAVVEASEVEVPPALIDHEVEHRLEDLEENLKRAGLKVDPYFSYLGTTRQKWMADARPDAEDRLKVDLVLEEATRRLGIEAGDAEVESFMREEIAKDEELKDRLDQMLQSRAARDLFRHRLLRLRTLERLVEIVDGSTPQEGK